VDLAPELPVLDGDSGKPAGVVIFFVEFLCRFAPNRLRVIAKQNFFCT